MNAALYIRVSSAEQVKGYSLEAQEDLLRRYASEHNMPVYQVYADEGKSANKSLHKRQALLRMVEDAEAKLFSIILFKFRVLRKDRVVLISWARYMDTKLPSMLPNTSLPMM